MSKSDFPCPAAKKCGGCQLTNMSYEEQLSFKQGRAVKLLGKFGRVERILSTNKPFFYRNKVQAAFGRTRSGEIISGVYQSSTHNIVKVDRCYIEDKKADAIIVTIRKMLKEFKLTVYNENNGTGFLRHVLIKTAKNTGEVMVVLVTGSREFKSKNAFCTELLRRHPEITTIIQNVNSKFTSLVLGEEQTVLFGSGYITDVLMGKKFIISPKSFYQINPEATVLLYETALKFADIKAADTVIDAYAGVGTIGMLCSDKAKEVISVEMNPDAVKDAKKNARLNNIENMSFVCADATEFLSELAKEGDKADVVIMDPPRAGSTLKFMKSVCVLSPKTVVYVSCNPETLARDLNFFVKNGYKVKKIQPVDMFPNTSHIETVVLISKI
ncbi:MAG: 23S rRNA (uracil(1939)-C(5))-methyltransferase RlmD [Oscillospiraceae bacterium]|nr:23S rRNA (uracil(1939)-C(5))-methyltransferase RlmD [Oscillospiraceae bacterium]